MPSERSARTSERARIRNRKVRSTTRTMVGKAVDALQKAEPVETEAAVGQAIKALDRAVTKGIIHPNNAARKKSRLMSKLNALKASEAN